MIMRSRSTSMTIREALSQLKKGILSVEELCLRCKKRQEKTHALNMYVSTVDSEVLSSHVHAAQQAYSQGTEKPLEGIPISFKDNFCTKGVATTCASKMLLNYIPPYNATMVTRSKDNGAVIMGKTNLDEFAFGAGSVDSCHGPVMNPWNLVAKAQKCRDSKVSSSRQAGPNGVSIQEQGSMDKSEWVVAGGSSGGSAAAVASGTCLASFGSDTGGSVRIPASYCGVVGLKPTYGLLSRHGLIPMVNSMDVPGIFTKNVEDCSLILNAVSGHDVHDSTTVPEQYAPFHIQRDLDLSGLHIGIPKEYHVSGLSEDVLDLWRDTADSMERSGARVSQVSMPHAPLSIFCYQVLCCSEVASNFSRYDGIEYGLREGREDSTEELFAESRHKGFNDVVRGRILAGNFFLLKRNYDKFFIKAQKVRRLISNDFTDVFSSGVDLVLIPTTKTDAPLYSNFTMLDNRTRSEEEDVFTTSANLAGVPGLSIPLKLSQRGLPLSLQLVGPRFSEGILLSLAHWLEQQAQFPPLDLDFLDDLDSSPS